MTNERIKNNDLNFHHSQLVIEGLGSTANVPVTNKVLEFSGSFLILTESLPEEPKASNNFVPGLFLATSLIVCLSIILIIIKRQIIMSTIKFFFRKIKR